MPEATWWNQGHTTAPNLATDVPEARQYSFGETAEAIWYETSPTQAAIDLLRRPVWTRDPDFQLKKRLEEENLWDWDREAFIGVTSEPEFQYRRQELARERRRREIYASAGWGGIALGMVEGVFDPTSLIPILGPAARAGMAGRGALEGMGAMALVGGVSEGILYERQYDRDARAAATAIGADIVLGGILGGAAGLLTRRQFQSLADDMVKAQNARTVSHTMPYANPAAPRQGGAAATINFDDMPGGFEFLSKIPGFKTLGAWTGPVVRGIMQERSPWVRWATGQFATAGLARERDGLWKIAAQGGTIESNVITYNANLIAGQQAVQENWLKYHFGDNVPKVFARERAYLGSYKNRADQIGPQEFRRRVTLATFTGEEDSIPEVNAAARVVRAEVYDKLEQAAVDVGTLTEFQKSYKELTAEEFTEKLKGDAAYGMRSYNHKTIIAKRDKWIEKLMANGKRKFMDELTSRITAHKERIKIEEQLAEDLKRPPNEIDELKAKLEEELKHIDEGTNSEMKDLVDEINTLREERRAAKAEPEGITSKIVNGEVINFPTKAQKLADLQKQIATKRAQGGEALKTYAEGKTALKRRLKNLNKSEAMLTQKQFKKLDKIEQNETNRLNTLNRFARKARGYIKEIESLGGPRKVKDPVTGEATVVDVPGKEFAAMRKKVLNGFEQAIADMERSEARRSKIMQKPELDPDLDRLAAQDVVVESRTARVREIYKQLDEMDSFDRAAWRKLIQEGLDEVAKHADDINSRRAVRAARLKEQADKLDPKKVDDYVKELLAKQKTRAAKIKADYQPVADDIDIEAGTANFDEALRLRANEITNRILGNDRRMPLKDLIHDEHGPLKARMLDIESKEITDFLEMDIDRVLSTYVRTMAADIELARKFQTPNASWLKGKLVDEEIAQLEAVDKAVDAEGKPLSDAAKEKERLNIAEFYRKANKDINGMIERIQGVRAIPADPRAASFRLMTVAKNLNVLRYMGLVLLASVTDPGRLVQKYGLMKTLSVPIRALTGGWKQIKMSARTAQLGGNAVDLVLHSRAHAFYDVFDGLRYGSKAERGVEWLTSKIGRIAFFDHWNVGMKSWAAVLENEVIMDSIATIMEGGSKKRVDKAIRELARRNLGEDDIQVIWEQVQAGGGGKINGVWLPETQNWDTTTKAGRDALRSYYSAMSGTLNETIITPGLERPLIVDQGPVAQMMFQFRSFAMSSITKTLLSNIQEHNMQTFNGMMVSIGLGMMSYYLYGVAKGGKDYEEMMNAPVEKWIDEGIIRSGQLAVLEDVMRAAQRIPATAPYASFSGTRSTVRSGGDFRDFFMGPTLDLAKDLGAVVTGLDDPTRHTLHMFRQLLPFQNHLFIRRGYDAIESQFNLPVKRSDR